MFAFVRSFSIALIFAFLFGLFSVERAVFADCLGSDEAVNARDSVMIAESVVYLQKAITQFESNRDLQSIVARIAPIVTVANGLLDAGVSPDEPLLQSSLCFLRQFYNDQKSSGASAMTPPDLLAKIEICLERTSPKTEGQNLADDTAFLWSALAVLDDSEAVDRAVEFVEKLNIDATDDCQTIDETQYVVLSGIGDSIRVCGVHRFLADLQTTPQPNAFSSEMFDCLIANVHGLKNYPFSPVEKHFPKQESLLAALPQLYRLNDSRKKSGDDRILSCFYETYRSFLNAFESQQSVLRRHLHADGLSALQTVSHLK